MFVTHWTRGTQHPNKTIIHQKICLLFSVFLFSLPPIVILFVFKNYKERSRKKIKKKHINYLDDVKTFIHAKCSQREKNYSPMMRCSWYLSEKYSPIQTWKAQWIVWTEALHTFNKLICFQTRNSCSLTIFPQNLFMLYEMLWVISRVIEFSNVLPCLAMRWFVAYIIFPYSLDQCYYNHKK